MRLRLLKCDLGSLDKLILISRKTFVEAFEKDNDPKDFRAYVDMAFDREKLQNELSNRNSFFYFMYSGEILTGYFKLNIDQAQTDLKLPEAIELERIYVLQEFQGQKIGQSMLQEAMHIARKKKKEFLWLGVWEKNTRAITFYKNNGFSKFGKHPYYIGKDKQMDWLMRCDVLPSMENRSDQR